MFTLNDILKPTLLILIAIFVLYIYNHLVVKDLKLCCDNTENYSHYDLVVGILSSRGNFDLRQSLRESWVGYARRHSSLNKRVLVKFIVSNNACYVPPEFRIDPYKCERKKIESPNYENEVIAYKRPNEENLRYFHSGSIGWDFDIIRPIILTRLGISLSSLNSKRNSSVRLYDRTTKSEIISVYFSFQDPGTTENGSSFKAIENFILPKDFKGSVVSENVKCSSSRCRKCEYFANIENGEDYFNVHKIRRINNEFAVFPEVEESIPDARCVDGAGTFMYRLYNSPGKRVVTKEEEETRMSEWQRLKDDENERLLKESRTISDILFVSNVDVYRNLPSQLLQFFSWLSATLSFSFVMKTDDDCFVNLETILQCTEELHD
ncbi:UDP-GalNAc:beta-1,3-N-acetylgalactosaminyltransferase 2-like isoform X2 [Xenia sp. Carnegie-2017]|uniref:UDP-GalNAc:beta-1, 3-N-acetylgalactosaminyltransferase 2-like isoform X2 n=1 Tax=Xenia sp. Carnegie-2017 TaxID=2897299 RepID=UPI001F045FB2|nr:UDP-GalNAc:beta-1,3-N-acetylgalactosaminyltransferase 2-like isoform X2 [Xenia sp. Carnegie-2017]